MFKVRPFESKTLSWWYSERDNIDFGPMYQRYGGLWSKSDKAYLIDSILNEFDIPKIYIADFTYIDTPLNQKNKSYAIIDGKQRFEAIFHFFDGKLVLNDEFEYSRNPSLKLGGLSYKDLKANYPKIASQFENYNLSVMSIITDEEEKINDLFVRLNRSKPLTGAEIRSAMSGQVPKLIKKIAKHPFFKNKIRFSVKRKQDENVAAKLLLIEFRGNFVDTKKYHIDRFVEEGIKSESTDFARAADRVEKVLDEMTDVFNEKDPLLTSSGILNIYYWLFRRYSTLYKYDLREFLVDFDRDRTRARKIAKRQFFQEDEKIDKEIFDFNIIIRSPNDQAAMTIAFRIISDRLKSFIGIN